MDRETTRIVDKIEPHLKGIAEEVRKEIASSEGTVSFSLTRGGNSGTEMGLEVDMDLVAHTITIRARRWVSQESKRGAEIIIPLDEMPSVAPGCELPVPELVFEGEPQPLGDDLHRSGGSR